MSDLKLRYTAATNRGSRTENQDNLRVGKKIPWIEPSALYDARGTLSSRRAQIFCVCDGMGGEALGDAASLLALKTIDEFTSGLTGLTHIQNRFDLVCPGTFYTAAAQKHHHSIGIGCCRCFDHPDVTDRHRHIFSVKAFGFIPSRKTGKNHCCFCFSGSFCCLRKHVFRCISLFVTAGRINGSGQKIQGLT